jgi:uncharacterized membrane protein YccC
MNASPAAQPSPDHSAARRVLHWLHAQTADWLRTEGERWIFVAKAMLASFSALWLAFRLGLDAPYCACHHHHPGDAQQRHGAGKRRSTVFSARWSAVRPRWRWWPVPADADRAVLGLALWVALCTGGAAMHRNQQSYSFVLAGYTAVMIAVPAVDAPSPCSRWR